MKKILVVVGLIKITFLAPVSAQDIYGGSSPLSIDAQEDRRRDAQRPQIYPSDPKPIYDQNGLRGWATQNPDGSIYLQEFRRQSDSPYQQRRHP